MKTKEWGVGKKNISAKRTVLTSFFVDLLELTMNLVAALITGSIVMIAETLQSISDCTSDLFLIIGLKSSKNQSKKYPLGTGRSLYVWILFSTMMMIFFSAGLSIYFGIKNVINPQVLESLIFAYVILSIAIFANGYSLSVSTKRLLEGKKYSQIFEAFKKTNLVETRTTVILDSVGFLSATLGLIALLLYRFTGDMRFDGFGAIAIGVILLTLSFYQIYKTKELLVGKGISRGIKNQIRKEIAEIPEVNRITNIHGTHIGLERMFVLLNVNLKDNLHTNEIEKVIRKLKKKINKKFPFIKKIQVELSS